MPSEDRGKDCDERSEGDIVSSDSSILVGGRVKQPDIDLNQYTAKDMVDQFTSFQEKLLLRNNPDIE